MQIRFWYLVNYFLQKFCYVVKMVFQTKMFIIMGIWDLAALHCVIRFSLLWGVAHLFCRNPQTLIIIQNNLRELLATEANVIYNVRSTSMAVRYILVDFINRQITAINSCTWMNALSDVIGRLPLLWKRVAHLFVRNWWTFMI